jgi:hypothetical protein
MASYSPSVITIDVSSSFTVGNPNRADILDPIGKVL